MKIFLFGNLCVENRTILPYVFALFYADFLFDILISCRLRTIENIKRNGMSVALNLR